MFCLDSDLVTTILNGATGIGAGSAYSVPGKPSTGISSNYTWQTNVVGSFSALVVALEGSLDGSNWTVLDTNSSTTGGARALGYVPITFMRAHVTTFTGGTSISVLVQIGG